LPVAVPANDVDSKTPRRSFMTVAMFSLVRTTESPQCERYQSDLRIVIRLSEWSSESDWA
jgi:hypothetical protein